MGDRTIVTGQIVMCFAGGWSGNREDVAEDRAYIGERERWIDGAEDHPDR